MNSSLIEIINKNMIVQKMIVSMNLINDRMLFYIRKRIQNQIYQIKSIRF
jgi:hypothetical protein